MTINLVSGIASPTPGGKKYSPQERARSDITSRLTTAIARLVGGLEQELIEQITGLDDETALAVIAISALRKSSLPADARARIAIKGALRFYDLINRAGGVYSTKDVMALLAKTEGAVQKMVARRQLIAFKRDGEWAFLTAQFNKRTNQPIEGLRHVLKAFPSETDPESITLFFLTRYEGTDKTPLELLIEGFNPEILAVSAAGAIEHGAR